MTNITLFTAPGSCSRVPTIVLEEIGLEFETPLIRFMKGEHKSPHYKKLNPKGKVPTLLIDGEALTENLAIITYLNERFPKAKLMPSTADPMERSRHLADLNFCSATLHPIVTRIRMPQFFANKEASKEVWSKGCEAMNEYFELIDNRLKDNSWWYGDQWSAMDAYLYWVNWRVAGANFPVNNFSNFHAHTVRMEKRPSVQKALARENLALEQLKVEELLFTPLNFI